ncbi:hypothetical protein EJ110_NYTH37081 [Nymphaea thermarum]|nr:hypothetical protein EJ110_NYTH37081 [Nymphaea thermarum]
MSNRSEKTSSITWNACIKYELYLSKNISRFAIAENLRTDFSHEVKRGGNPFSYGSMSHRTWKIRSTWTQSSPDAVEVPASSFALSEILPPPPPATSPRSAAAVPCSAAGSGYAAVKFCFSAPLLVFLPFSVSATVGGCWFCAVACHPSPLPLFYCRLLFVPVPPVAECLFVMAEEMGPKNDVVLDAGSTSKTENVPIQVTSIRLTKDNYLSWSAALEIGITSRGRLSYITGNKPAPSKSDPQWATWALEDSQVKMWIISSVSSDIQPLILRKPTSFDMWNVLAKMYGRKKRHLCTYQIKRSIYSLKQGDLSVAAFYVALKTKWEELDYHVNDEWKCGSDHSLYWEKEWMDRTFLFLGGLRDEFEPIRSQILNGDEIPGIEEVYARVESEEQRRQVMHLDTSHGPSAFVSRASGTGQRPARRCTHCNKLGHSVDFCWDIHPEKRLVRGRPPSGRRSSSVSDSSQSNPSSGTKSKLSPDQLKELQAYISRLSTTPEEAVVDTVTVGNDKGSHMEGGTVDAQPTATRDHLFGQGDAIAGAPADVEAIHKLLSSPPLRPLPSHRPTTSSCTVGAKKKMESKINQSIYCRQDDDAKGSGARDNGDGDGQQRKSDAARGVTPAAAETATVVLGTAAAVAVAAAVERY